MPKYDPLIYPTKSVAMQRILDFAQRGYPLHVSGVVPTPKVQQFVEKMAGRYMVHLTRDQRRRARERGEGVAILIIYPAELREGWWYWLLVTEKGRHPAHEQEPLLDFRLRTLENRIRWGEEFEVVGRTRPRTQGGNKVVTWQMQKERYEGLRSLVQAAARQSQPRQAREVLGTLRKQPGFSGVRAQVHSLLREFKRDWGRHHRSQPPQVPKVPYLARRSDEGARPLSEHLSMSLSGNRSDK